MKVLCEEQYTPEWNAARRGKVTASGAHFALAKKGGKGRRQYIEQICNDLEGIPDFADEETAPWFIDGHYYESWARGWYSWNRDVDVREIGFAVHDEYEWIGASPDGLLDPDGGLEIKYRKFLHTYQKFASLGSVKSVTPQVQTSMFVCDRKWWDYENYWRSDDHEVEKGHIQRIERDDAYIENTLLPAFVGLWAEVQDLLEEHRRAYTRHRVR